MPRVGSGLTACALALTMPSVAAAQDHIAKPADFARYVETFNSANPSFVDYYAADVVFDKGAEDGVLVGRQAIAEWYVRIWQDFDETLTPLTVAIDLQAQVMMVELRTELVARRNGLVWRGRTYRKGDRLIVDGTIVYGLGNGLIRSIRGAAEGRQVIPAASEGCVSHSRARAVRSSLVWRLPAGPAERPRATAPLWRAPLLSRTGLSYPGASQPICRWWNSAIRSV
jgi:hypothetical protein